MVTAKAFCARLKGRGDSYRSNWVSGSAQSRRSSLVVLSVVVAVIGLAIPKMIAVLPPQRINLPNKNYWLAPERLAETTAFLNAHFAWFTCALFLFNVLVFDYAIQINLHPQNPPSPARFWYILAAFLVFVIVWTIPMLAKFLRPRQPGN